MFNIQVLNTIAENGLAVFPKEQYKIGEKMTQPDAILVRSYNLHDFQFADSVQVVGRAGVGINNIPVDKLTQQGIPVLNTPGANTNAVRELVLAGMLLASRHLCAAWEYVRTLDDADNAALNTHIEKDKKQFSGTELRGRTLGVIGLGHIGVQVANAASGLGMQIIGYDPAITVKRAWELSSDVKQAPHLEALLSESDFVTLHVPLIKETHEMVNTKVLSQMKKGAILLNFSRGEIIDEQAVLNALDQKMMSCYVSDFPSIALKNHPQVICLPHLGASTQQAEENCAIMVARQIRDFLEKGTISHAVNFPEIDMPNHITAHRLALTHTNTPGMVAQISSKLAVEKMNILGLQNGSHNDIAYTLIDLNSILTEKLLTELKKIDGMIRVRKIEK
ncbi:MAG: 3-phosphoglycerate dehydrogenase family protein [Gammaproteobacteria bacterium]|nr:3-phosphoglycerate dehydrogenase family protein [Gammaproteobacteria bacterium]